MQTYLSIQAYVIYVYTQTELDFVSLQLHVHLLHFIAFRFSSAN